MLYAIFIEAFGNLLVQFKKPYLAVGMQQLSYFTQQNTGYVRILHYLFPMG